MSGNSYYLLKHSPPYNVFKRFNKNYSDKHKNDYRKMLPNANGD